MTQTTLKVSPVNIDNEPIPEVWYIHDDNVLPRYKEPLYRVIIGADPGRTTRQYHCYRTDEFQRYVVDTVDFEDPRSVCDQRFIFDQSELDRLLNDLLKLDDNGSFYTIAHLGTTEIDTHTLLPII